MIQACTKKVSEGNCFPKEKEIVFSLIYDKHDEKKRLWKHGILASFSILNTLLMQGISIRRRNLKESNFCQINKDKTKHAPGFKLLMEEGRVYV